MDSCDLFSSEASNPIVRNSFDKGFKIDSVSLRTG